MGSVDWGCATCRFDGSMGLQERGRALNAFKQDPGVTILLATLKCAGVGLDLSVANFVFLMDIWWNPAAEDQAIDRVHRIGQSKQVRGEAEARVPTLRLVSGVALRDHCKLGTRVCGSRVIRRSWRRTWGCDLFLPSFGCDSSGYCRVAHGTGLVPSETQFPCRHWWHVWTIVFFFSFAGDWKIPAR